MSGININSSNTLIYLGLKFIINKKLFVMNVNNSVVNTTSFDVLLNPEGLYMTVKCNIIVKKCLPILL